MNRIRVSISRGFTLIEVLISMAVLAIGLAAVAPLLQYSIERNTKSRKLTTAQQLAQDVLERLRAEIRYDGAVESSPALAAADAWKFDVLPHAPGTGGAGAGCQPAGANDGVTYDHGPFVFPREDQDFVVCYRLARVDTTVGKYSLVSPNSVEARFRVLWRGADGGWQSWTLTDLLVSGD